MLCFIYFIIVFYHILFSYLFCLFLFIIFNLIFIFVTFYIYLYLYFIVFWGLEPKPKSLLEPGPNDSQEADPIAFTGPAHRTPKPDSLVRSPPRPAHHPTTPGTAWVPALFHASLVALFSAGQQVRPSPRLSFIHGSHAANFISRPASAPTWLFC